MNRNKPSVEIKVDDLELFSSDAIPAVMLPDVIVMGIMFFVAIHVLNTITCMKVVQEALVQVNIAASYEITIAVMVVPCTVLFCKMWRQWLHELSRIHEQANNFSVFKAQCYDEEDRPKVQRNIIKLMRAIGLVQTDASDDAALRAFDTMVHLEVPRALEVSLGRVGILYRHACVIFLPLAMTSMDSIMLSLSRGRSARYVCFFFLAGVTRYLAVYPALLGLLSLLMRASLRLQKCALIWTAYVLTALIVVTLAIGWDVAWKRESRVYESSVGPAVCLAVDAAMFALVAFLYRQ
jgi:hypothetical protein